MNGNDRPLGDDEAALVFRRASELDVELAAGGGGWDLARLQEVGREVGISAEAVQRAVAEVRLGDPAGDLAEPLVRTIRIVPAPPEVAQERLGDWLRDQLLTLVRDRPGYVLAERRDDEEAQRRRRRDNAHRYRLGAVDRVAVAVAAVPGGGSAVRVEAQLWADGVDRIAGLFPKTLSVVCVVTIVATVGLDSPVPAFIGTVPVWTILTARWRAERRRERRIAEVAVAVEGAIDRLERSG